METLALQAASAPPNEELLEKQARLLKRLQSPESQDDSINASPPAPTLDEEQEAETRAWRQHNQAGTERGKPRG